MLVGDSAVAQHQADGAADLPGIDVLLHEAVDACDAIRGERDDLGGKRSWSNEHQGQRQKTRAIHSTLQYYGGAAFPITASRSWGARCRHSFLRSAVSAARNVPRKHSVVISNAGSSFFAVELEYRAITARSSNL